MSREGAERLTTNRAAAVAGVSIGSLYQYFPDKEALIAEVRRRHDDAFRERLLALTATIQDLPLEEAIARCVLALIELHREDPALHNAVAAAGVQDGERRLLHQLAASWLQARRGEVRSTNLALAAEIALDAAESLVHGAALRTPERLANPEFAKEVIDLLRRYLSR
ncbi:TetR/AcrR family transcriptional regulator [Pendulispora albinea]|uniref:TetR/AcrR family transcriptional regulator n=1 Tax=Pendulispora albinea TaxID=2741071 RepID=A0ABZ2LX20_9BACT